MIKMTLKKKVICKKNTKIVFIFALTIGSSNAQFIFWFATWDTSKCPFYYESCKIVSRVSLAKKVILFFKEVWQWLWCHIQYMSFGGMLKIWFFIVIVYNIVGYCKVSKKISLFNLRTQEKYLIKHLYILIVMIQDGTGSK